MLLAGGLEGSFKHGIVYVFEHAVHCGFAVDLLVFEDDRKDFQKMRFTATEEAGNPSAVADGVGVIVFVEESEKMPLYLVCDDELIELISEMSDVARLDDGVDRAVDVLFECFSDQHLGSL